MSWIVVPPVMTPTISGAGGCGILSSDGSAFGARLIGGSALLVDHEGVYAQADHGYVVFKVDTNWVMANRSNIKFGVTVDDTFLALQSTEINGLAWFQSGSAVCYYSGVTYGFVYSTTLAPGTAPIEYLDDDETTYLGDAFWAGTSIIGTLTARGSGRDVSADVTGVEYTPDYARWELASAGSAYDYLGEYTPVDGATEKRYVGNARWNDSDGGVWTQNSGATTQGKAYDLVRPFDLFGGGLALTLTWNAAASAYVAGAYGDSGGWWQNASAPIIGEPYTITFTVPEESEETGVNISLSHKDFVAGDLSETKADSYAFELAVMV